MKFSYYLISVLALLYSCSGSDTEPFTYKENTSLKTNLQGTWQRTIHSGSFASILVNHINFNQNSISWYDSTANMTDEENGEIQTVRGMCPVRYTFNDGIQHYNPLHTTHLYSFSYTTENDILWVYVLDGENSTITNYKVKDGIVTLANQWITTSPVASYVTSSYVVFHNNFNSATFCEPLYPTPDFACLEFERSE